MDSKTVNIPDVALIIEGGGMRASYTAGAVVMLLEHGLHFGKVYGISAGSSHAANYVSGDIARTKASFVDLVKDSRFGGMGSFLRGEGYFNSAYLYEGVAEELDGTDATMSFDFERFWNDPADVHIEGFDWDTGETVAWTKSDMSTLRDLMLRVRASSTMPVFMPPTNIDGHTYLDGGIGESWGILLDAARRDGFERFFIIRSQERGYRKKSPGSGLRALFRMAFRGHPLVAERSLERWWHYNDLCEDVEDLERQGAAYVFYPERMTVTNKETDFDRLQEAYDLGYTQAQREVCGWETWLDGVR